MSAFFRSKRHLIIAAAVTIGLGMASAKGGIERSSAAAPLVRGHTTCESAIGAIAAERLRNTCIAVSLATHPPCGTRNSCALLQDEIARRRAIVGDRDADYTSGCGSQPSSAAAAVAVLRRF